MNADDIKDSESESSWLNNLGHDIKKISEETWFKLKENLEWLGSNVKSGTLNALDELETFLRDGESKDFECNCESTGNTHETNNHLDCHCHHHLL